MKSAIKQELDFLMKDDSEGDSKFFTDSFWPYSQPSKSNWCNDSLVERRFHILDEVVNESDSNDFTSHDLDIPDEEVERMLEAALPNKKQTADEAGLNHFNILPEGWIQVTHNSGMPLYLSKATRVCTMSQPYFLGPGSVRKHEIPISAIPCLSY